MGKAEEVVRRRQQKEQAEREAVQRARQDAADQRAAALRKEVREEIRSALSRLEVKGFPGGKLATRTGRFGTKREFVYWYICEGNPYTLRGDEVTNSLNLRSDGTIWALGYYAGDGDALPTLGGSALSRVLVELRKFGV